MSVQSVINKHGISLTYRHKTSDGTYSPATGAVSGSATTDYTVKGYPFAYDLDEIDGSSVLKGDGKLLIYTKDTSGTTLPEPEVDDLFLGAGDTLSVVGVRKLYSRGSVKCYILQVRE